MELRQLKYFVTLAKTLNFSDAAEKLFITQGTLSHQIRQLEDELGIELFHRTSHSVSLTEAGAEMLPLARKAIEASTECHLRISDLKHFKTGTLNIGLTSSFRPILTDTLKSFLKKYPGIKLNIFYKTASELTRMLLAKEVDFILAFKPARTIEQIESELLFESQLSVIMRKSHPLADRKELKLADIAGQKIALPGSGLQARKAFERYVNINTANLDICIELNDPNIIIDILHSTDHISIMSSLAICYDHSLLAIPLAEAHRKMEGCVHWLKDGYRKHSAEAFMEMLRESAQITRIISEID